MLGSLSRGSLAEELATADPQADAKVRVAVGPIRVPDAKKHRIKKQLKRVLTLSKFHKLQFKLASIAFSTKVLFLKISSLYHRLLGARLG